MRNRETFKAQKEKTPNKSRELLNVLNEPFKPHEVCNHFNYLNLPRTSSVPSVSISFVKVDICPVILVKFSERLVLNQDIFPF